MQYEDYLLRVMRDAEGRRSALCRQHIDLAGEESRTADCGWADPCPSRVCPAVADGLPAPVATAEMWSWCLSWPIVGSALVGG